MQCFVTGATGFIGSAVAQQLVERNYKVTGLTHSPGKCGELEKKGIRPVVGDMRHPETWISRVKGVDIVIHTATIPIPARPGRRYLNELMHAQGTVVRSLIDASSDCRVFIYTSGMSVYGHGDEAKTEASEINPVELARPYVAGEHLIMDAIKRRGLPGMILRPGGVYGDGGIFAKYWTTAMSKGRRTAFPGNGSQVMSFISVEDCARAFVRSVENPMPGEVFNIVDDEAVEFGTIIRFLAEEMDAPKPFGIPATLFRLLSGNILAELLLTNKIGSNKKMKERLGVRLLYPTYREGIPALADRCRRVEQESQG